MLANPHQLVTLALSRMLMWKNSGNFCVMSLLSSMALHTKENNHHNKWSVAHSFGYIPISILLLYYLEGHYGTGNIRYT